MKHLPSTILFVAFLLAGCASTPKDYTAFRQHHPKSILILPPINNTNDVNAGYSMLTTATIPIAELGYYVFPVVVVDQFLKENGLPTAAEMNQAPLDKLHSVFGADAVLYLTIDKYGTKYIVISSDTYVHASARLVDCRTGTVLWEERVQAKSQGNAGLLEALVAQVVSKLADEAHMVAQQASFMLFANPNTGLLKGPRHPEYGK